MNLELKPCPFCGGEAHLFVDNGARVICLDCRAGTRPLIDHMTTRGVAGNATLRVIEAWNQRVDTPPNEKRIEDHRMARDDILRRALYVYGAQAQTMMVMEEMAELQKELCKHSRGKLNMDAIAEEIADVQIMLEQMIVLHDCANNVAVARERKLARLEARLEEAATEGCEGFESEEVPSGGEKA